MSMCLSCNGAGYIYTRYPDDDDLYDEELCFTCEGKGEIDDE